MSTPRKYKFTITWDATAHELDPDYSGNKRINREQGYQFYREEWNGDLVFYREDYDTLIAAPIETKFDVLIEWQDPDGYYQEIFSGYFTPIEFNVDVEDRKIEVRPINEDKYSPILDAKDLEVDLVSENCPTTPIKFKRYPAVQIYFRASGGDAAAHQEIMTIVGDNYFSSYVNDPTVTSQDLQNIYHFAELDQFGYIPFSGQSPNVSGVYELFTRVGQGIVFRRLDGQYWVATPDVSAFFDMGIYDSSDNKVYETDLVKLPASPTYAEQSETYRSLATGDECRFFWVAPFARVLCNADTFDGSPTEDIPEIDIVEDQLNYTKVAPYEAWILQRETTRIEPSVFPKLPNWSLTDPGEYHIQFPYAPNAGVRELPLFPDKWTTLSWWWVRNSTADALLDPLIETVEVRHAFKLKDVVLTVAQKLGADITEVKSDFFYDAANVIRAGFAEPFIIPKSNMAINDYDGPATRAIITWTDIDTYLKGYNSTWYISGDTLRIEHISWYENGGHYTAPVIGADLTKSFAQNGENWGYGQHIYKYDKPQIPERQEFDWNDEVSDFFEGYPIVSNNFYVNKGQFDQISLAPFVSDIDRVILQESSLEGFVIVEGELIDGEYYVAILGFDNNGMYGEIQNGHCSLFYMLDTYHRHSQPCSDLTINNQSVTASSVKRNKVQTVDFPDPTIDPMKLITTDIGNGKARSLELDLVTGMMKIEIEHDTE